MKFTYRYEWVKCGKNCKGCPHGPYVYAYWREAGRLRKKYCGRATARDDDQSFPGNGTPKVDVPGKTDPRTAIFSERTASLALALSILGLSDLPTLAGLVSHYRLRSMEVHPDRGGSDHEMRLLNCAYAYARAILSP